MYSPLSQKNLYNCALTSNRKNNSQSFLRCFSWVAILKIDSNKILHSATMLQFKKKRVLKIFPKMKLEFCTSFCFLSSFLFPSVQHCTCSAPAQHLLSDIGHSWGKEGSRGQAPGVSRPCGPGEARGDNCGSGHSSAPPFLLPPHPRALYGSEASPRPQLTIHC